MDYPDPSSSCSTVLSALPRPCCWPALRGFSANGRASSTSGWKARCWPPPSFPPRFAAVTGSVWIGLLAGIGASLMLVSALHGVASITFRGNQTDFGRGDQFPCRWPDRADCTGLVQTRRAHPPADGHAQASRGSTLPGSRADGRRAFHRANLYRNLFRATPFAGLHGLGRRAADLVAAVTAPALACACAPWAKTPQRWTPPVSRSWGCVMPPWRSAASCAACGGAYLSTALQAGFVKDMSAGRGFIALAALIFAKWRPWYALSACLLVRPVRRAGNPPRT